MRAKQRATRARPAARLKEVAEVLVHWRGTTTLPNTYPKIQRFYKKKFLNIKASSALTLLPKRKERAPSKNENFTTCIPPHQHLEVYTRAKRN
jgi:hypothetical protein